MRNRGYAGLGDSSPPDSPRLSLTSLSYPPLPAPKPGKPIPPPVDPGVFRSVTTIRRLIDEASELAVRASSGMSAAALGSIRGGVGPNIHTSPWALAQSLGMNPLGDPGGGRNVAMSAMRIHRLRALAVQKLAAAYRADEIASSVMVMQGGSIFEDIAERVLKVGASSFFRAFVNVNLTDSLKIRMMQMPSMFTFSTKRYPHGWSPCLSSFCGSYSPGEDRQLAESTTTAVLDELIKAYPQRLELYRTRGIVRTFRDEYSAAVKDFTHALKESRALRKARTFHRKGSHASQNNKGKGDKRKRDDKKKSNGQAPPNGTSDADGGDTSEAETPPVHPSILPDAPEPIEPQLLFLRAAAYLQNAIFLVEERILKLEGICKRISGEGAAELRLCYLQHGRYGGVEIGNPAGPLGKSDGPKLQAYRSVLADDAFREQIGGLLKKSIRDHERFLAHFDALETPPSPGSSDNDGDANGDDVVEQAAYAFFLSEALRPGSAGTPPPTPPPNTAVLFTTYHPLLVESHFSMLLCLLMLGDFPALLRAFIRAATVVDGLEGYPVFLPPRSMAQVEFIETLERLAGGWRLGVQPHSRVHACGTNGHSNGYNGKLAIEPPPPPSPPAPVTAPILTVPGSTLFDPLSPSTSLSASGFASGSASASTSTSALALAVTPSSSPAPAPTLHGNVDRAEALDCARIILAPVAERQRGRVEQNALEKRNLLSSSSSSSSTNGDGMGKNPKARAKSLPINIPLHGPRVEVVLAWLAAVWLVEFESVGLSESDVVGE